MATRKSPSRGTGSRPAKATTAIGKTRSAAKKPLKVSAKTVAPEPESNVVPLTATEPGMPEPVAEPAPVVEEVAAVAEPEPAPVEDVAALEAAADEAPEVEEPVEDETVEETKLEASWPFGMSASALFSGFPKMPAFPEIPAFGAVDMNACVASGTALAEGMRSLGEEMMDFSRKAAERNVEATMALFGASSVEEVIDLQSRYAVGSADALLNEGAKLTGMAIEVANKAVAPFTRV